MCTTLTFTLVFSFTFFRFYFSLTFFSSGLPICSESAPLMLLFRSQARRQPTFSFNFGKYTFVFIATKSCSGFWRLLVIVVNHTHSKVNQAADDDDYWTINRRIIISINLMGSVNLCVLAVKPAS